MTITEPHVIETSQQFMQQQIDDACAQADPGAPDSLTELVRTVATQTAATPEQVVELRDWLESWADQGDRLDRQLRDAVDEAHQNTTEWLPGEREQWQWCEAHPTELMFSLEEAQESWAEARRSEVESRENVAAHCAALVDADEHGTDARGAAICDDWHREWSSIVD